MRFFDLNDPNNIEEVLPEKAYRMVKAIRDKKIEEENIENGFSKEDIALVDELKDLIALRNRGSISRREFRARRKKIFDRMMK